MEEIDVLANNANIEPKAKVLNELADGISKQLPKTSKTKFYKCDVVPTRKMKIATILPAPQMGKWVEMRVASFSEMFNRNPPVPEEDIDDISDPEDDNGDHEHDEDSSDDEALDLNIFHNRFIDFEDYFDNADDDENEGRPIRESFLHSCILVVLILIGVYSMAFLSVLLVKLKEQLDEKSIYLSKFVAILIGMAWARYVRLENI